MKIFDQHFVKTRIFLFFIFLVTFIWIYYNPPKSWQSAPSPIAGDSLPSEPMLQVDNQSSGAFFVMRSVELPWTGFVIITSSLVSAPEVIGVSDVLSAGIYSDIVVVPTARAVQTAESLRASLVKDNGNGIYDAGDQIMPVSQDFVISGTALQPIK